MRTPLWRRDGDRITLLGKDGREMPPVPRRDPINLVAFSVRPRGKRVAEVHVAYGDRFVFAAVVRDDELPETVQSFAVAFPEFQSRKAELLALLRQRWAIEVSHYMASRTARRGVHP